MGSSLLYFQKGANMDALSLRETRVLLEQVRRDVYLRPSGLRPVHLVHCEGSGSCGDTAAVRSGEENNLLDGDRPMVDRSDLLESELQDLVREAWFDGYAASEWGAKPGDQLCDFYEKLHELVVSHLDCPTGDVGAQDETSEEGAMGDGVRP